MTSVEEKYIYTTNEENIVEKDWAAGSSQQLESKQFVIIRNPLGGFPNYVGKYESVIIPPALEKIIDEPIVNALDHLVRSLGTANPVTCIKVSCDANGRIKIYNTGSGIEVVKHKVASEKLGREMYVPTFLFGTLFQGSNRVQAEDSIIGGTNGLGAKLSNCFSIEFILETCDGKNYFLQRWKNHKSIEEPPIIRNVKTSGLSAERIAQHTTLSFIPDYKLFGYDTVDGKISKSLLETLTKLIRTRVFFAAAYAQYTISTFGSTKKQPFEIWFNDERIEVKSMSDIATIFFPTSTIIKTTINPIVGTGMRAHYKYPWEVCAVIVNSSHYDVSHMSNVNGVVVRDGKHHKYILGLLNDAVKEKMAKIFHDKDLKFSPSYVSSNMFLFLNTKIPKPSWTGQRKDCLDVNVKKLAGYTLDTKFTTQVSEKLRDQIIESMFNESNASGKKKAVHTEYEKYEPAKWSGDPKRKHQTVLIPVEGDSAFSQVRAGVTAHLGWDRYGIISLGGVIMNARKKCTVIETSNGKFVKKSKKLEENIFMNVLAEVTGLNTSYKYEPGTPSYKKEMKELRYGCIAACVDQDLDGKGNILGILLSTFELFWPNLLRAGFIKWFCSPIIRAYPKSGGKVHAFYNDDEYIKWTIGNNTDRYDIQYYKGLGTHSRDETISMFKTFREHLYTYYMDDKSHDLFEIYYGNLPDLRKQELSKPTRQPSAQQIAQQESTKLISCSDHLEYETNLYQKDNLDRKLDHVIDGQNQAGRKILDGLIKALPGNKKLKVAPLGGYISQHENYHHGEASLCDSITGKAFVTTGGKQLPFIIPLSNFGSRLEGGNDAASVRYIWTKLNKNIVNLIFPDSDYWLLPFNFDEGKRSEPKHFVPIIPLAITESTELPAHGWKLKTWGRDVFKIIENIRRLIRIADDVPLLKLPANTYKGTPYTWKGEIKTIRGELFSFGRYSLKTDISGDVITITELPLRVWTMPYIADLKKKQAKPDSLIAEINNASDDISINIIIRLKPGAMAIIDNYADSWFTDGIEEYFLLRDRMDSHINLMGADHSVKMFGDYESVMYEWFPIRKDFYGRRYNRDRKLLELKIIELSNITRYIEMTDILNLSKRKKADMEAILMENNFDKIYIAKLNQPKFTPAEELDQKILKHVKASYNYLLGLSDLKKSEESLADYRSELTIAQSKLVTLENEALQGRFVNAAVFERELDELEVQIREGQRTFWQYGDANKFTLD